jgi:phage terminase large subunit-like protein
MASSAETALTALELAVLESGAQWGETAAGYQRENASAILDVGCAVRQSWVELPRGARKTTDLAGLLLVILLFQAPAMSRSYVGASDEEQAAELVDAAEGLIARTPEFQGLFHVTGLEIASARSGASFRALSGDPSAMGKRAYMIVLDEVANWPQTRKAQKFWTVLTSGNRKIVECRTVVITNAGEPGSWQWKRREVARTSPHWRFHSTPGPLPWLTPADLESLRENSVTESEFERLHLNRWIEAEDRLASRADLDAATTLPGPLPAARGRSYALGVDLATTGDTCVVTVMHREDRPDGTRRVVLDRICRWHGTRDKPVHLGEVAQTIRDLVAEFHRAAVIMDPWQGKLIAQQLTDQGTTVHEYVFTATSVGKIATALHSAIRQRRIDLPNNEELLTELGLVRLVKNTAGVYRLDHDTGEHDDQAVALALAVQHLLDAEAGPHFPILSLPGDAAEANAAEGSVPATYKAAIGTLRPHGPFMIAKLYDDAWPL